jgi:hypothetical protein
MMISRWSWLFIQHRGRKEQQIALTGEEERKDKLPVTMKDGRSTRMCHEKAETDLIRRGSSAKLHWQNINRRTKTGMIYRQARPTRSTFPSICR